MPFTAQEARAYDQWKTAAPEPYEPEECPIGSCEGIIEEVDGGHICPVCGWSAFPPEDNCD